MIALSSLRKNLDRTFVNLNRQGCLHKVFVPFPVFQGADEYEDMEAAFSWLEELTTAGCPFAT